MRHPKTPNPNTNNKVKTGVVVIPSNEARNLNQPAPRLLLLLRGRQGGRAFFFLAEVESLSLSFDTRASFDSSPSLAMVVFDDSATSEDGIVASAAEYDGLAASAVNEDIVADDIAMSWSSMQVT